MQYREVPDAIRGREKVAKGRPLSQLSQTLLRRKTAFVAGPRRSWGNLYRLAKERGMRARIKRTRINSEEGYVIWFDEN